MIEVLFIFNEIILARLTVFFSNFVSNAA